MRRRLLGPGGIVLVMVVLAAFPAVTAAATRQQATNRIASCLKRAGAPRVIRHGARGGRAFFRRPFNAFNRHYVQWGGYFTVNGQVRGTIVSSVGLSARQRRAANRCLQPFNGHV